MTNEFLQVLHAFSDMQWNSDFFDSVAFHIAVAYATFV